MNQELLNSEPNIIFRKKVQCKANLVREMSRQCYVNVVVQFYPWFKFSFLLLQTHYHVIIIHYHTQKQKKRKFEPRIKLNHNINMCVFQMTGKINV